MRGSLLAVLALAIRSSALGPSATAANGVFVGVATAVPSSQTVNKFLGVPFAITPPERFSPPVKPANSNAVRQATSYGPNCIQTGTISQPPAAGLPADSEDCLYLNVWAPSSVAPSGGRSVMVWFYGGGFLGGGSNLATYEGSNLAAVQDVVVVSFNYRTNVFGFPGPLSGVSKQNPGLLDQRLALDWVKHNVASFGGNPSKVTIFGESAGAVSVDFLSLTMTPTTAPFRAAIMESGTYYLNDNGIGLLGPQVPTPVEPIITFSNYMGCGYNANSIACLRSKTTAQLKTALDATNLLWQPSPDGVAVPYKNEGEKIRTTFGGARVPTVLGTNRNEGTVFVLFGTPGTFAYLFGEMFPELQSYEAKIRAAYPIGGCSSVGCYPTEQDAVSQTVTDYIFDCMASREGSASALSLVPTYRYYFNRTTSTNPPPLTNYVVHSSEIPFVFGTIDPASTPDEILTSKYMQSAWGNFAKNPLTGPGWKRYTGLPLRTEVAMIGGPANPGGRADVDVTVIDHACGIYQPIYLQRDPVLRKRNEALFMKGKRWYA